MRADSLRISGTQPMTKYSMEVLIVFVGERVSSVEYLSEETE